MKDDVLFTAMPLQYEAILYASKEMGFAMPSDLQTGSLLKTLVASKPSAKVLELGTGTGLATSWLLDGMDTDSELITVDNSEELLRIAKQYLTDKRARFICEDGYEWLSSSNAKQYFDVIFADAMPGKYDLFDDAWQLLKENGFYIVDDMLPQPNWPDGHAQKADDFIAMLEGKQDAIVTKMNWSTGIIILIKRSIRN